MVKDKNVHQKKKKGKKNTFAKRLTTLPIGVVSKKTIGTLSMLLSRRECRIRDAETEALARSSVPRKTKKPAIKAEFLEYRSTSTQIGLYFAQEHIC